MAVADETVSRAAKVAAVLRPLGRGPLSRVQAALAGHLLGVHWTTVYRLRRRFLADPVTSAVAPLPRDGRLSYIQTPVEWVTDRQGLPYCFRCLVLNDADVSAPRWKREWLEPTADYCRVHHSLLEAVPASVFRRSGNFAAALWAINYYRAMRRRKDTGKPR
jgi:hypothetical protein